MPNYVQDLAILNKLNIKKDNRSFTSVSELQIIVDRLINLLKDNIKEGVIFAVVKEFPYTVIYNGYTFKVILNIYND